MQEWLVYELQIAKNSCPEVKKAMIHLSVPIDPSARNRLDFSYFFAKFRVTMNFQQFCRKPKYSSRKQSHQFLQTATQKINSWQNELEIYSGLIEFKNTEFHSQNNYNMRSVQLKVQLNHQHHTVNNIQGPSLAGQLIWRQVEQQLVPLYDDLHPYIYSAAIVRKEDQYFAVSRPWGKQLSTLSKTQLQSFLGQPHLLTILSMIVQLRSYVATIDLENIFFQINEQPKILVTSTCSEQIYFKKAKHIIANLFFHMQPIMLRNEAVKNMRHYQIWLTDLKPKRQAKPITQLLQLKLEPTKNNIPKIALSEQEKSWIMQQTEHSETQQMQLLYNGASSLFNPAPLHKIIQKRSLLFLLETTEGRRAAFWMAAKPEFSADQLFGQYYADKTKKSVLLGINKRSVHRLGDEAYSVGLGNQVLLSIGKTDIVLSAFNISNVSFFPCSYSKDSEKGVTTSEDLLGNQFILKQLQAYGFN